MNYFLAIFGLAIIATINAQTIISRAAWGARPPKSTTAMSTPVPFVIIHHGASAACTTQSTCSTQVRNYQNQHMDVNGWSDIGYNFVVGEDGLVYEGRGWSTVGAHAPNFNSNSIGICVIGNFVNSAPNAAAQNAVRSLIATGVSRGSIRSAYTLKGHRDVTATECPGNAFYNVIKTWPNFVAGTGTGF